MQRWRHASGSCRCCVEIQLRKLMFDFLLGDMVGVRYPWFSTKKLKTTREDWQCTSRVCQDEGDVWKLAEESGIKHVHDGSSGLESHFDQWTWAAHGSWGIGIGVDKHNGIPAVELRPDRDEDWITEIDSVIIAGHSEPISVEFVSDSINFREGGFRIVGWESCKQAKTVGIPSHKRSSIVIGLLEGVKLLGQVAQHLHGDTCFVQIGQSALWRPFIGLRHHEACFSHCMPSLLSILGRRGRSEVAMDVDPVICHDLLFHRATVENSPIYSAIYIHVLATDSVCISPFSNVNEDEERLRIRRVCRSIKLVGQASYVMKHQKVKRRMHKRKYMNQTIITVHERSGFW